jgi:hypothetical protein
MEVKEMKRSFKRCIIFCMVAIFLVLPVLAMADPRPLEPIPADNEAKFNVTRMNSGFNPEVRILLLCGQNADSTVILLLKLNGQPILDGGVPMQPITLSCGHQSEGLSAERMINTGQIPDELQKEWLLSDGAGNTVNHVNINRRISLPHWGIISPGYEFQPVPEFHEIAFAVASVLGMIFILYRTKKE